MAITKSKRRLRIRRGIRNKIKGTADRPRLSLYKSNKGIYAQLIDDLAGSTLAYSSSEEVGMKGVINIEVAQKVGEKIAQKAGDKGISTILFDRSGYPYHGKVKALAEGARNGGLKF